MRHTYIADSRLLVALGWSLAACSSSSPPSEGHATLGSDAAVDGGGPGSTKTWALLSTPVLGLVAEEFTPVHTERTARIGVITELSPCERPAMPLITWIEQSRTVYLEMRAWRSSSMSCAAEPHEYPRLLSLRFPTAGIWTIAPGPPGTPGAPLTLEVLMPPVESCAPDMGISCDLDCDCPPGDACLSGLGLTGPFQGCGRPCEFDRDCAGTGVCLSIADGLASICEQSLPECSDSYPCPEGYACTNGVCAITISSGAAARRPCAGDSECDRPLHCVAPASPSGISRCEVLCPSASPTWCMFMHACGDADQDAANLAQEDSVCVWIGE